MAGNAVDLSKLQKQAVRLGREYRITLSPEFNHNLTELAQFFGVTPHTYAHHLMERAIQKATHEVQLAFVVVGFMSRGFFQ